MLHWIKEAIQSNKLDQKDLKKIELACEEVLVNIISYAYPDNKGMVEIEVFGSSKDKLEIVFVDQGKSFNPLLKNKNIDPKQPLDKRSEGGLGIIMIRQIMDEVHYNREDSKNVLRLIRKYY